jgi:hypothetical protein
MCGKLCCLTVRLSPMSGDAEAREIGAELEEATDEARIYGWQGASANRVNMKSPTRFEVGANTGVVQVSRGVLHLESVP